MQPLILRFPLTHFIGKDALPLTRNGVFDLARRTGKGTAKVVYVVVTVPHEDDGLDLELATIELNSAPRCGWRLQYVSHPARCNGLTARIAPCASDFEAFIQVRKNAGMSRELNPICARDLEDEGLGPLAALNLRCGNSAPVLPSKADLDQLMKLAGLEPAPNADAGQSSKNGPKS